MSEKRHCSRKTKKGKACRSWALHGLDVCLSHADEETRRKVGFGGPENAAAGGKAKRVPRLTEVLSQRVEERADEIMDKLFLMLDAQRAVVVGTGPKARVEVVPDQDLALKAIREIYDRFEGRPKQATELSGPDGGPIPTEAQIPTDKDFEERYRSGLVEAGLVSANGASSNGSG